jgi:acyl carrier protein
MSEQELRSELKSIIAEIIEIDDFDDADNFVEDLGVDSMLALEIVARIEKRYRVRIPEERFAEMQTLNSVMHLLTDIMQPVNS